MKRNRLIGIIVAVWVVIALVSGCSSSEKEAPSAPSNAPSSETDGSAGSPEAGKPDISKEVKLKMIMIGNHPPDTGLVYEEVNRKLKQDINATVELEFIPWADVHTKIPLILSSGEEFDVIQTANWDGYFENARNGAFHEITQEDLKQYAPQTFEKTEQDVFDSALVDGKLYALPMNAHETTINGYGVRGDLLKKYGLPGIQSLDDFENYLDAVKTNEKDMIPWDTVGLENFVQEELTRPNDIYSLNFSILGVNINDNKPQIMTIFDTPQAIDLFKRLQKWNQKGYWAKGAIVDKVKDTFKNGKSATLYTNLINSTATYQALQPTHPQWDLQFFTTNPDKPFLANPFINNGNAISAKSKNYERALMMLDLFRNDEEYNNLTTYGIKGKHFDLTADKKLVSLPDSKSFPPNDASPWGWRNDLFFYSPSNGLPNYDEVLDLVNSHLMKTNIRNFTPNYESVKSYDAAIKDITNQYLTPLYYGIVKVDVEADIQVVKEKMMAAGLDKIIQELQRQLDSFQVVIR
ncbi:ABC transporter substrate-binding protein [Paenibacillus nasutitermitis]|uniref:ABC transporter substrate binding lipoprotein n=1 Tax=Paenibacillus nasutitermitis TaxID=1652958 RepID=A0A917E0R8_9BACL|nr:extracellular solute-binding protein [Paenibacillus nasutitermitis]GGD88949.1 putative ABC transporter substrate binding lipoprotein [Paenibacillus nasutitermitis]